MGKVGIRDDKFKLRPDSELYIACEEFDFSFFKGEVEQVKQSYKCFEYASTLLEFFF